jgi:ABC-type antimicrobial peptide transport system permease subunit
MVQLMRRLRLRATIALALQNLGRHKLNVALALLSVITGVSSVITMLAIAEGARLAAARRLSQLGAADIRAKPLIAAERDFQLLFAVIAAISLLIGGVGVMSIMLVTVSERAREIGIRRALGARRRDIVEQFLIETTVISAIGGLIGVVVGVLAPVVFSTCSGLPVVINPLSPVGAFAIAVSIGVLFGVYPAWRAATLDPAEALREP